MKRSAPPARFAARAPLRAVVVRADDRSDHLVLLAHLVVQDLLLLIRVAIAIALRVNSLVALFEAIGDWVRETIGRTVLQIG